MKTLILLSLCLCLLGNYGLAQNKSGEEDLLYKNELTYGINVHTNGALIGGFAFRYARAIKNNRFHHYSLDIVGIKHPKEVRSQSLSGGSFIPGKQNYFYLLRPMYGREFVLFRKSAEQGVQVSFIGAAGPSIGLLVPYVIEYRTANDYIVVEQYDPVKHDSFDRVVKSQGVGAGMSSLSFAPGASLKAAFNFEVGNFKANVTGFEAGFVLDAMLRKPIIMPLAHNRRIYTGVYFTLFYGSRN